MADFDIQYDTTPAQTNEKQRGASITAMKSALSTFNSTSYSAARLTAMTENDLAYACKVHNLTVAGM